jgi:hypothetical protein
MRACNEKRATTEAWRAGQNPDATKEMLEIRSARSEGASANKRVHVSSTGPFCTDRTTVTSVPSCGPRFAHDVHKI